MNNAERAQKAYDNAVKNVDKLNATLFRHKKTLAKKEKILAEANPSDRLYWLYKGDVEDAELNIRCTARRIKEAIEKAERLRLRIADAKAKDDDLAIVPAVVTEFAERVEQMVYENLLEVRAEIKSKLNIEYGAEYCQIRSRLYNRFGGKLVDTLQYAGDAEVRDLAKKSSQRLVKSFIERAKKVAGDMLDFSNVRINFNGELDGYITGTKGNAVVYTIIAGGYNIQCLHVRVLVKPRK